MYCNLTSTAATATAILREQTVKAVFEPRMGGPTMSLEEFADKELADALRRQKEEAERAQTGGDTSTMRYRHLEEQGLEDDLELVDAATDRDRDWDAFKEANPRGWGNKMK
jgi:hypothetical protein